MSLEGRSFPAAPRSSASHNMPTPDFCLLDSDFRLCFNAAMQELLKQVSRSFYMTLRVLPRSIRPQLSLAYLLARATDTVADTQLIAVERRREALLQLRTCIREACQDQKPVLPDFEEYAKTQNAIAGGETPAERALIRNIGKLLGVLREFSESDRSKIRDVLDTIIHGQKNDLIRFGAAAEDRIYALVTDEDLDRYTYEVAGCVGEFWTRICRAHLFPETVLDDDIFLANAVRFGKGLQLVNILRDLPKDLRQGRCYLPQDQLSKHDLKPQDLLIADSMDRFRPLYQRYLKQAEDHLLAGWHYAAMLPFRCVRVRLACAWPILIGVRTIGLLRQCNILDNRQRIKLSRSDIRRLIFQSIVRYPSPKAWNRLFNYSEL
jgi:farnesyl-diphosphate farnesyltransferase